MPDDLFGDVGGLHTKDASNVLEDDESIRNVLPEEPSIFVQDDAVGNFRVLGDHWENDSAVTNVRVEDPLQAALVADLAVVHGADALGDGHHLGQLKLREQLQKRAFNGLDLIIENLNLMSAFLGQILVEQRHLAGLESLLTVPILKVGVNATWMDDLVRWGQGEVKEAWDGDGGDAVGQRHRGADVVAAFQRITSQVEMLLWPDDVDLLAVVERLADERNVHQTEQSNVTTRHLFGTT